MGRLNRIIRPTEDVMLKLCRAQTAIASQKAQILKCPYCGRSTLIVFEDTCGHIQTKCKGCGQEIVFALPNTGNNSF